ncbi:MAG: phosphonate ABC transporter [Synechococcus sp.]|nr:phosphonate ABC transporter [Synechococcus sp.]
MGLRPAAPLLPLLPALVLLPLSLLLPGQIHGGGWELIGGFAWAALTPSLDPLVLMSLLKGLGVTVGMALLGWVLSLAAGLVLGLASSYSLWRTLLGRTWPAWLIRRLLALPRAIHELLWGLLLLQVLGLQPVVAVLAIAIPFGALVARVVADLTDALPTTGLEALRAAGVPAPAALLTALGPPLLPGVLSYGGYRLECALRSATLLGVFGLGGLGTDLKLTLQSLEFHELWSGLWLLLAVMLTLEALLGWLRRRWLMPRRLGLRPALGPVQATTGGADGSGDTGPGPSAGPPSRRGPRLGQAGPQVGRQAREMGLVLLALLPVTVGVAQALQVDPAGLLRWQALPPLPAGGWPALLALPWPALLGATLLLTAVAALLAVGLAPLQLLLAAPWPLARVAVRLGWALARLWPPPLTVLLLLFVLKPGLLPAALALGLHNGGILGRLLLESLEDRAAGASQALLAAGAGERPALLYGGLAPVARPYLAYGAYRADVMLRETVVVGLAGAAGLGSQLLESLSSFAWDQLAALLLVYAALTLLGEELSDRLRRRLLSST